MDKITAMVVDDYESVRNLFKRMSRGLGFELIPVEDGFTALNLLQSTPVDVIFLDVRMPRIDGLETLRRIKKMRPTLPVYMMTGSELDYVLNELSKMGAEGFLFKPFELREVSAILEKVAGPLNKRVGGDLPPKNP
ncbi:MAG TPA: response regulator [Elusimicrobiota bacterium]|nr:response regulator [Elusimicrobiota bacterium]